MTYLDRSTKSLSLSLMIPSNSSYCFCVISIDSLKGCGAMCIKLISARLKAGSKGNNHSHGFNQNSSSIESKLSLVLASIAYPF